MAVERRLSPARVVTRVSQTYHSPPCRDILP